MNMTKKLETYFTSKVKASDGQNFYERTQIGRNKVMKSTQDHI